MKKANVVSKPKAGTEVVRYSQRDRAQAVFFSPSKHRQEQVKDAKIDSAQVDCYLLFPSFGGS